MPVTGGYKPLETGQDGLSDLEVQGRLMFYGYNALARHSFGFSPIDVTLLKTQIFALPTGPIVILCQSEETDGEGAGYVKGFRDGCSFKSAFAVCQGTKQQRVRMD
jgi:hypothetical protein